MRVLLVLVALVGSILAAADASQAAGTGHSYLLTVSGTGSSPPLVEIVDGNGHVQRLVARAAYSQSEAARWSPDGSHIAWVGHDGVSVERADGSGRKLLLRASKGCGGVCTGFSFAWSPDGQSLAVGGAGLETNHLLVVSASTGRSVDIAPATPYTNYSVVGWMPGGRSLVYERSSGNPGTASCCRLDLRVAGANGAGTRVVYRFPDPFYKGSSPALAPDGTAIAFMTPSDDGRGDLIRVVALRSGKAHAFSVGFLDDQAPAWSPDSRRLAMPRLHGRVVTVAVDGSDQRTLGIPGSAVTWTHRGEIIVLRGKQLEQVWAARDGQTPHFLFRVPDGLGVATIDAH